MILRGVTGQPLEVPTGVMLHFQMAEDSAIVHQASVVDVSFPGDILIGMNLSNGWTSLSPQKRQLGMPPLLCRVTNSQ